jgi:ketosteroid isomerase-like protein
MPPHHPSVNGLEAIRTYFRNLFSRSKFNFTFTSSQLHLSGDTAFERVTYTATIRLKGDDMPVEDIGKGLHVFARQSSGSWKLTHDIWNSDKSMGHPLRRGRKLQNFLQHIVFMR